MPTTASVINIDPVVSGKPVGIRSSLQEHTRSSSARRRSMPDQPTGSIIMNTAVSKKRYYGNVESYPQQIEHHNDQPPNHTTYDANEYGDEVDGNRWRNDQVRQEQEYHPNHAIRAQPHQSGF